MHILSTSATEDIVTHKQIPFFKKMLIDILAGTIAGINATLVGHPFDTIKVRLQTQPRENPLYNGVMDCIRKTIKWEGIRGLFAGMASPFVGQIIFRGNLFFAYGLGKRYFSDDGKRKLRRRDYYYSGAIAWGWGAVTECPIEVFKTQMQVQIVKKKCIPNYVPEFNGLFDCIKKIVNANGIAGCYQGFVPHLIRNIPGGALHLGTFECVRLYFAEKRQCEVIDLPISITCFAASCGGVVFWTLIYPFDVVKSEIQSDSPFKENKKFHSVSSVFKFLHNEGGYKRFFVGLVPCLMRAVPFNIVLLLTSTHISEKFYKNH
jgi:solute carrier family 25 carnitine/acylcarnitine transporter 20/29